MKLTYHRVGSGRFPNGYWYASTDDGGYDGDGETPLDALADLVQNLEIHMKESE